ncbi:MAG: hypothetical protein QNJ32_27490 [Xenococcaceae cyanobacterium MO_167.B27]|nr:hypothetical protein [Xenococcaceae cyanobacterium MO_167.B27]
MRFIPIVWNLSPNSKPQRQITVDANRIRSQVRYILRDCVSHFEYGGEEDIATEEISSLIQEAQMYTKRGDSGNAIAVHPVLNQTLLLR